jgi:hypothetical protein
MDKEMTIEEIKTGSDVSNRPVTAKETALKTIAQFPENASWEDIQERIHFIASVHKGIRELNEGKGIPHERVKQELDKRA